MKEMDKKILAVCLIDKIEREVEEAEGINTKVVELQAGIKSIAPSKSLI